jgi:hypothetical protein
LWLSGFLKVQLSLGNIFFNGHHQSIIFGHSCHKPNTLALAPKKHFIATKPAITTKDNIDIRPSLPKALEQ